MIDLLKKTDRECTIALQQPNREIDSYRAYYEGRQSLAKELLLKWQQCAVSGSLEFLELKLKKVTAALRKPDIEDAEYHKLCAKQEQIVHAMRLISHLGANDR